VSQTPQYFEAADETRARLVAGVASFERELVRSAGGKDDALAASWAALVRLLALESPAQTRRCPRCDAVGMRAATRCGRCWSLLTPLPNVPADRAVAGGLSDF
jgi:hypothetical protein